MKTIRRVTVVILITSTSYGTSSRAGVISPVSQGRTLAASVVSNDGPASDSAAASDFSVFSQHLNVLRGTATAEATQDSSIDSVLDVIMASGTATASSGNAAEMGNAQSVFEMVFDLTRSTRFSLASSFNAVPGTSVRFQINGPPNQFHPDGVLYQNVIAPNVGSQTGSFSYNSPPSPTVGQYELQIIATSASANGTRMAGFTNAKFTVPPIFSADFDRDVDVDSMDLTVWNAAFGINAGADADADADSDGADFLLWQRQLGSAPPLPTTRAVPEPATLRLLVLGTLAMLFRRRVPVS